MIRNQIGATIAGITVGIGVMGVAALIGASFLKNTAKDQAAFATKMEAMGMSKLLEGELQTDKGCAQIIGKAAGEPLAMKIGNTEIHREHQVGSMYVKEFRFDRFLPTDAEGFTGIAEISMMLQKTQKDLRPQKSMILLPVNMEKDSSGVLRIASCNTGMVRALNDVVNRLCGETYGLVTRGLTCAEVIARLETFTFQSICVDLYGPRTAVYLPGGGIPGCDLSLIHEGKACPVGKYVKGYDDSAKVVCADYVPPVTAVVDSGVVPPPPPAPCSNWSGWSPSTDTQCPGVAVNQTRSCLDNGSTETQSQTLDGSKTSGCASATCEVPVYTYEGQTASNTCNCSGSLGYAPTDGESGEILLMGANSFGQQCTGSVNWSCSGSSINYTVGYCNGGMFD